MRHRQSKSNQSVSLFPFLAVLICAMGALIFLLIVTTRRIRKDAVAQAIALTEQESSEAKELPKNLPQYKITLPSIPLPIAPDIDLNDPLLQSIALLQTKLTTDQQQAAVIQNKRLTEKKEVEKIDQKIVAVQHEIKKLQAGKLDTNSLKLVLAENLSKTKEQIALYQRQTKKHRNQMATASSKYQFLPYEGDSGTTRRPILIECTDKGIRFLQEGITLTPADLEGFTSQYNPLLLGSKALATYWNQQNQTSNKNQQPKPYVLLVVRPSGSRSFYIARALLKNLKQPFGYELIEENIELAIPATNPNAKEACLVAIRKTLKERKQLIASLQANPNTADEPQLRFQKGGNGFEVVDENPDPFDQKGRLVQGRNPPQQTGRYQQSDETGNNRNTTHGSLVQTVEVNRYENGQRTETNEGGRGQLTGSPRAGTPGTGNTQSIQNQQASRSSSNSDDRTFPGAIPTGRRSHNGDGHNTAGQVVPDNKTREGSHRQTTNNQQSSSSEGSSLTQQSPFAELGSGRRSSSQGSTSQLHTAFQNSQQGKRQQFHRNGIGFERSIPVVVTSKQLTVGDEQGIAVGKGESKKELMAALIKSLNQHVNRWGPPPQGFYWVPKVKFKVSPGGNQYYERVQGSLQAIGIGSTTDYLIEQRSSDFENLSDPKSRFSGGSTP